jgi:hypothetical protein
MNWKNICSGDGSTTSTDGRFNGYRVCAARFGPGLTTIERITLLRDAVERLRRAGIRSADVRNQLWINEAK